MLVSGLIPMKAVLKYTLVLAGLCLAVLALRSHLDGISSLIGTVDIKLLLLALAGLLLYQLWNASVWSEVLDAMGSRCKRIDCTRIWLESESLKWLPGTVWSYGSRVISAQKIGISKTKASASIILELILTNTAWAALAITIVSAQPIMNMATPYVEASRAFIIDHGWFSLIVITLSIPLLIMLARVVITKLKASPRFSQLFNLGRIDYTKCLLTAAHYIILCLWNATLMWVVFQSVPAIELPYLTIFGIAGVAWMIGFWSIGIPGGIGVREAIIVLMLSQYASLESSVLAAVLWRGAQMFAEISALIIALIYGAKHHFRENHEVIDHP